MTKREAISQIKHQFKKVNADAILSNKLVWSLVEKHSKWIIHRDSEKLKIFQLINLFQTKPCIEVIEAPLIDSCCDLKKELKCKIYRTKNKIPEIYSDFSGPIIKGVFSLDFSTEFKIYNPKEYKRISNDIFSNKNELRGYFYNSYLYFPDKHIDKIQIEAMFIDELDEETSDCSPCKDCENDSKCKKYLDKKWIIPDRLQAMVIGEVLKELSSVYIKLPEGSHEINKNENIKG